MPIGVFQSGGVDSTVIATLSQQFPKESKAFTVGFHDQEYDESSYAEKIAKHSKKEHVSEKFSSDQVHYFFDHATLAYDEPFADSAFYRC